MRRYITSILLVLTMVLSLPCQLTMAVAGSSSNSTGSAKASFEDKIKDFCDSAKEFNISDNEVQSKLSDYIYYNYGSCDDFNRHTPKEDSWLWKLLTGWTKDYGVNLKKHLVCLIGSRRCAILFQF